MTRASASELTTHMFEAYQEVTGYGNVGKGPALFQFEVVARSLERAWANAPSIAREKHGGGFCHVRYVGPSPRGAE